MPFHNQVRLTCMIYLFKWNTVSETPACGLPSGDPAGTAHVLPCAVLHPLCNEVGCLRSDFVLF